MIFIQCSICYRIRGGPGGLDVEGRKESEYLNLIYLFSCQKWTEAPRACLLELEAGIMRLGGRKFRGEDLYDSLEMVACMKGLVQ